MDQEATRRVADSRHEEVAPRRMVPLDRAEALRLLGTVSLGRIVFTQHALPTIRPVNHFMDGDHIVIQVHDDATVASVVAPADTAGVVVAYEADVIDPETHLGWSVVITGYARHVTDKDQLARYAAALRPWVALPAMTGALRIEPDLVSGSLLVV